MLRSPDLFLPPVRLLGCQVAIGRRLESEQHAIPGDVQSELARCEPDVDRAKPLLEGVLGVRSSRRAARLRMSGVRVRREKAALSRGCEPHPATAPAGSNRSKFTPCMISRPCRSMVDWHPATLLMTPSSAPSSPSQAFITESCNNFSFAGFSQAP